MKYSSINHHICFDDDPLIECVTIQGERPYPVINLGDVSIFPNWAQLVLIRDAIVAYLEAHPEMEGVAR